MDAKDLFKQLTCGVNFAATKTNGARKRRTLAAAQTAIKKEKIEPLDDAEDNAYASAILASDAEIKSESDSDDNDDDVHQDSSSNNTFAAGAGAGADTELNIFGNIVAANLPSKKPKKPITVAKLVQLDAERINAVRNRHQLHVSHTGGGGANAATIIPEPLETFDEMQQRYGLPSQLVQNLHACGYLVPTAIQMQVIPVMCQRRKADDDDEDADADSVPTMSSLLACAPTGSGKTATFLVPIVRDLRAPQAVGFRALVLCPTRELAKQTQRECLRLVEGIGLRVHTLSKTNNAESRYGAQSSGQFDVLVTTPQRVCHLLGQQPPALSLANVQWLILDEADKLFEEGTKSFRDQFDQIHAACTHPQRRVALFSATHTNPVARWLRKNTTTASGVGGAAVTVSVGQRNAATALVDQRLQFVGSEAGKLLAFRELIRTGLRPPVLVFVDTKDRAEQLHRELIYDGINVDCIHADRTQQQRDASVKSFREGRVWVLICTELIGRGIDFKGVNLVVNYDFPPSAIAYIHRIGRTGRAGRRGEAVTYFTQEDVPHLKAIARVANSSGSEVPAYMLAMKERSKRAVKKLKMEAKPREAISTKFGGPAKRRGLKLGKGKGGKAVKGAKEGNEGETKKKVLKSVGKMLNKTKREKSKKKKQNKLLNESTKTKKKSSKVTK